MASERNGNGAMERGASVTGHGDREPFVASREALDELWRLRRTSILVGAGLAAVALGGAAWLYARGRREPVWRRSLAAAPARLRGRGAAGVRRVRSELDRRWTSRREARARGFWAGILASAGSTIASTVARRVAETAFERMAERQAHVHHAGHPGHEGHGGEHPHS